MSCGREPDRKKGRKGKNDSDYVRSTSISAAGRTEGKKKKGRGFKRIPASTDRVSMKSASGEEEGEREDRRFDSRGQGAGRNAKGGKFKKKHTRPPCAGADPSLKKKGKEGA